MLPAGGGSGVASGSGGGGRASAPYDNDYGISSYSQISGIAGEGTGGGACKCVRGQGGCAVHRVQAWWLGVHLHHVIMTMASAATARSPALQVCLWGGGALFTQGSGFSGYWVGGHVSAPYDD